MKRIRYNGLALALFSLVVCTGMAAVASAAAPPNGAILYPRFFNDCPVTTLSTTNLYPATIQFDESNLICGGGQNLHPWDLSADGGASSEIFNNTDAFHFALTLVLHSEGTDKVQAEGGIRICPWWDHFANGYFNVRTNDGEIACFGGVLPFYSFTGNYGIHYSADEPIRLEVIYLPNCNTKAIPGTIEYIATWRGVRYSSGPQAFGNCTPGEEAHGCYGIMDDARVGGRAQQSWFASPIPGSPDTRNIESFFDIFYEVVPNECAVPTQATSWGHVKATYR